MRSDEPAAVALINAIRGGDLAGLRELLDANPGLASEPLVGNRGSRTPLHVATDWPGYWPNGPEVVRMLLAAGGDPNAGPGETPLHWAASSDDLDVAEVLIEGGADVEAPGGSIAETPLANAVGYGCWHVGRLLLQHGARVEHLWIAAGLGLLPRVKELVEGVSQEDLDHAFWQSCHGGQRRVAEFLLGRGANLQARPWHSKQTPLEVAASLDTRRENLVGWLKAEGA